ncbi:hypothetical protein [Marisediminicola sp. LYQ134]|uniref:hypothetical protein n=1 Tax=Marisediminicola sp. LYQ134 TaxID=3391061 RepID=UPI0039836FF9
MNSPLRIGLIVHADRQHGVAQYARALADRVVAASAHADTATATVLERGGSEASDLRDDTDPTPVHAHFTDRLWGPNPGDAAAAIERIARRTTCTVTLHDVPQPSDGRSLEARIAGYQRVVDAAAGIVVNSEHERLLLADVIDLGDTPVTVIPLPVEVAHESAGDPAPSLADAAVIDPAVAILGFFYPGKGHREVVDAVAAARVDAPVRALGRVSDGHEADLAELESHARALGVDFAVTGYLDSDELVRQCRRVAVPVIAHTHFSASGSMATWIGAGRRPIVVESRYAREMEHLRPGTLTIVSAADLGAAVARAISDPVSTRVAADADTRPHPDDTVAAYRAWWAEVAS